MIFYKVNESTSSDLTIVGVFENTIQIDTVHQLCRVLDVSEKLFDLVFPVNKCRKKEKSCEPIGKIIWKENKVIIEYFVWNWGRSELGIFLRILNNFYDGQFILEVWSKASLFNSIQNAEQDLPDCCNPLPFLIEIQPIDWWLNLECHFHSAFSDEVSLQLDYMVRLWAEISSLGGFQITLDGESNDLTEEFGVGVEGPTVGEDFIQWQIAMSGVNSGSIDTLINIIAVYSVEHRSIRLLYIG